MTSVTERSLKPTSVPDKEPMDLDEAEVFLDATTMRSRIEFDPEFARSLVNMISKAAEIVEESRSANLDKPSPQSIHSIAAYNELLLKRQAEIESTSLAKAAARLRYEIARESAEVQRIAGAPISKESTSVDSSDHPLFRALEVPHTPPLGRPPNDETKESFVANTENELSPTRVLVIGGIPISLTTIGVVLLVESALDKPVVPNPYIALFAFLSGLALVATAVVAIHERKRF
jgi:hypothetical protein